MTTSRPSTAVSLNVMAKHPLISKHKAAKAKQAHFQATFPDCPRAAHQYETLLIKPKNH
jgi:hypothetical protein